jgi:hypothetical protein
MHQHDHQTVLREHDERVTRAERLHLLQRSRAVRPPSPAARALAAALRSAADALAPEPARRERRA